MNSVVVSLLRVLFSLCGRGSFFPSCIRKSPNSFPEGCSHTFMVAGEKPVLVARLLASSCIQLLNNDSLSVSTAMSCVENESDDSTRVLPL